MNNILLAQKALTDEIIRNIKNDEPEACNYQLLKALYLITDELIYTGRYNDGTQINYLWKDAGVSREDSQTVNDMMLYFTYR